MKEKGFSPEPEEDEAVLPPTTRGGEFMADWLRKLKKSPETEEDEGETGKKPKSRFGRLFNKLFSRMATKEEISIEQEHPHIPLYELFMPPKPDNKLAESEVTTPVQPEVVTEDEVSWSPRETPKPEKQPVTETPTEYREPQSIVEPGRMHWERAQAPDTVTLRSNEYNEPRIREQTVFERRSEVVPGKREQIIERRVAEPLAVLEYFLRRRAVKNVERRVKKETASLEKRLRQGNQSTERLDQLTQKSQEQLRQLREKRDVVPEYTATKTERSERIIEQPVRKTPEKILNRIEKPEKPSMIPESKIEYKEEALPVKPEVILEKVAEAAEHNAPLEKVYERRHEIKDEPTKFNTMIGGSAVSISTVLASTMQQSALTDKDRKELARLTEKAHRSNEKSLYKQAAVSGFWAALIILVSLATILFVNG
jgi:hypothetical protein